MVLRAFAQPLAPEERPLPQVGAGEVLVRVGACGVCGTDVKASLGAVAAVEVPRVLGHEVAGEIIAAGNGSAERVGERVALYLYRGCGACTYCRTDRENMCVRPGARIGFERDGGFAEYLTCASDNALAIPNTLPFDTASILCDAAATALRAVTRAGVQPGQSAAVVGIGGLGSFAVQLAQRAGARVVAADVVTERLESAAELGAETLIDLRSQTLPGGLDAVLDFAGVTASASAGFKALAPDGVLVVTGYDPGAVFPVATQTLARSQRRIAGSRGSTRADLQVVIDLVATGQLRTVVGDRYLLEEAGAALERVRKSEGVGRAVLMVANSR